MDSVQRLEQLAHLTALLRQHQANIQYLEQQAAIYGSDVPLDLHNKLEAAREQFATVQTQALAVQRMTPVSPDAIESFTSGGQIALLVQEERYTRQRLQEKLDRDAEHLEDELTAIRADFARELAMLRADFAREQMTRFWAIAGLAAVVIIGLIAGFVYVLLDRFVGAGLFYLAPSFTRALLGRAPFVG